MAKTKAGDKIIAKAVEEALEQVVKVEYTCEEPKAWADGTIHIGIRKHVILKDGRVKRYCHYETIKPNFRNTKPGLIPYASPC